MGYAMITKNCGVCNEKVDTDDACIMRKEHDGEYTVYHGYCEGGAKKVEPCIDCGHHRTLCSECAEVSE